MVQKLMALVIPMNYYRENMINGHENNRRLVKKMVNNLNMEDLIFARELINAQIHKMPPGVRRGGQWEFLSDIVSTEKPEEPASIECQLSAQPEVDVFLGSANGDEPCDSGLWGSQSGRCARPVSDLRRQSDVSLKAFATSADEDGSFVDPAAVKAPNQRGITERHGKTFKLMLLKAMGSTTVKVPETGNNWSTRWS